MIYIGIPARDERHTVGPLLWRIRELLEGQGRDFHVLVLDDASTDGTADRLKRYRRVLPLTVIRHEEARGYAASLEDLVREAVRRSDYPKRDALVTLQADFTDPPEEIPEMVRRFEGGMDLVTAGRGSEEAPRAVRLARLGGRLLARGLPRPEEVEDPFGTFRLYRLFVLDRALSDLPPDRKRLLSHAGWAANAELLLRVWPHVRQSDQVEGTGDYRRRYRGSRFRPLSQVTELRRAAKDPGIRALGKRLEARPAGAS